MIKKSACEVIKKLLLLDSISNEDISLYINSPGGSVVQGLAIIDCMNFIKSDVNTVCVGQAASMGAIILASGTSGKRFALENSDIMIHEVSGTAYGDIEDLNVTYANMNRKRETIIDILISKTKKTRKEVIKSIRKDNFMNSKEAKMFGIIDKIIFTSK